jgi:hypothetical protein
VVAPFAAAVGLGQARTDAQLPPQTRSYDNDAAGGLRGRFFCSAGTPASVLSFMTQQLAQQGWQPVTPASECGQADIPSYGSPQCWQNGKYDLFLGLNTNTDWVVVFIDPAFVS